MRLSIFTQFTVTSGVASFTVIGSWRNDSYHGGLIKDERPVRSHKNSSPDFSNWLSYTSQVQIFNLLPGPGGSPQKLQAGLDTWIIIKTPDIDASTHFLPPIIFHKPGEDGFQGDAVKRVVVGCIRHLLSHYSTANTKNIKTFMNWLKFRGLSTMNRTKCWGMLWA